MIVRLLGFLDFFSGLLLLILQFHHWTALGLWFGLYLLVKGIVFISNVVSMMDILAGIMMILAAGGYTFPFTWVFVLWLLQKGFFSLFSS